MKFENEHAERTALVTGAAGFIGSHVVEYLLLHKYSVRVLDLPSADFPAALGDDLNHPRLVMDRRDVLSADATDGIFSGVDYIFHCAGMVDYRRAIQAPEECMETNIMTLVRVLEAGRLHGMKKIVSMSSSAVYGHASGRISEDHPLAPVNPYGLSKLFAENAALHWNQVFKVPTISLRLFNIYGPRGVFSGLIGRLLRFKREGKPLPITGDGSQKRDFVYVTDVAEAAVMAAESDRSGEIYNVGTGAPQSVRHVAGLIGGEIEYVTARPGDPGMIAADIGRISSQLGWAPRISIEDGIHRTLEMAAGRRIGETDVQSGQAGARNMAGDC